MREEFIPLIKSCGTRTVPAAATKSIGLQADAQVVMVFARHHDRPLTTIVIFKYWNFSIFTT